MNEKKFMTIDGKQVEINGEKNLLALIRNNGIEIPTFCYDKDLSVYGACRMCMVENEWGGMDAACTTPPREGMVIKTNTPKLIKYRKMILELLLANHCRDCSICVKSDNCKLQEFARRFNLRNVRFPNTNPAPKIDDSSLCITRDASKCILCGLCVRTCNEIQSVGAIDYAHRGSKMTISTAFEVPLSETGCVGCGQCAAVCPTGAIVVKDDTKKVLRQLFEPGVKVIAQVAPAVRTGIGKEFGLPEGEDVIGKIVASLRRLGFDKVFDTSTTADLTIMEESAEFFKKLEEGKNDMPLFTSCCPGWIQYAEKHHPEIVPYISTCRSPMQMFSPLIKEYYGRDAVSVAIMPCTAKKYEAARDEFKVDGNPDTDYVITTQELAWMIREAGIDFKNIEPESIDEPFDVYTGGGVIFGVTGGVTEAVIRKVVEDKSGESLDKIALVGVRGLEGVKAAELNVGDTVLKIAVVSGLKNADKLIESIKNGEHYDFVEVMACPGGCINGAGQPSGCEDIMRRADGLYAADKAQSIRSSELNPVLDKIYEIAKGKEHELFHVHYKH